MRIWKLKDEYRNTSRHESLHDLVCIEMGDRLLFIHEEGTYDVSPIDTGLPTVGMWDLIADDP